MPFCSDAFVKYASSIGVSISTDTYLSEGRALVDAKEEEINMSLPQQYWIERRVDAGGRKIPGETQALVRLQAHVLELCKIIDASKITNDKVLDKVQLLKKQYGRYVKAQ